MTEFSHIDKEGNACMVDIAAKNPTFRQAEASCEVLIQPNTIKKIKKQALPKGDVLNTAKIAGIIAAKNTFNTIPLCHNIKLTQIDIKFEIFDNKIIVKSCVKAKDSTGAEMEALTAASVSALTIYDMIKAVDKTVIINNLTLNKKSGGKSKIMTGKVISINTSYKKGIQKKPVAEAVFIENYGIKNDAHAEENSIRQVSLLSLSSFNKIAAKNIKLDYGDFGENITVDGVDVYKLPIGTVIEFPSGVKMSVSKIGKECHSHCRIYEKAGDCVMPREGIFVRILNGGIVKKNDLFKVILV